MTDVTLHYILYTVYILHYVTLHYITLHFARAKKITIITIE